MAVKRTPADSWFSKCVRIRTNWDCEYCNQNFEFEKGMLHCSHFISRSYLSTRYHPLNAFSHCHSCHDVLGGGRWGGGNIAEFTEHYDEIFDSEVREVMRLLSKNQFRKHKFHLDDIAKHYRAEYKRMEQIRLDGETERLSFDFYSGSLELNAILRDLC